MTELLVTFDVLGDPKPQGSKKAVPAKNDPTKAITKESGAEGFAAWRNAVAQLARTHHEEIGCLDGPLRLTVTFRFRMPTSRRKADRLAGWIYKTTAPDTSKLIRNVEDGLQAGGLIADDARFAVVRASKVEVHERWTGARISIERLP